jgi:hypothetical protein
LKLPRTAARPGRRAKQRGGLRYSDDGRAYADSSKWRARVLEVADLARLDVTTVHDGVNDLDDRTCAEIFVEVREDRGIKVYPRRPTRSYAHVN